MIVATVNVYQSKAESCHPSHLHTNPTSHKSHKNTAMDGSFLACPSLNQRSCTRLWVTIKAGKEDRTTSPNHYSGEKNGMSAQHYTGLSIMTRPSKASESKRKYNKKWNIYQSNKVISYPI